MRREGDLTLAVTAARLAGSEGGVAWTLRDITERARLEQAKSDFVATASHELRSPLTSIKGFIELLETTDNENLTERQREFIRIALQSTDRLVELVNDLLDIARIEAGQFEIHPRSVDLRDTVEEVAALMAPRIEAKRQRLDVQIHDPRPPALADPARVRQIVTNLVTNAHLYTPEEGSVTLRLAGDGQGTTITVADTGPGIAPEEVRRLFDRFFRGSSDGRKSPGTGLGLAIVKSLVDLHGGAVDVQSTVGRGTTFTVRLPSAPGGAMSVARPPSAPAPAAVLAARRVLIVDDEPALAALIAQQLQPLGLSTVQVNSGVDALARLRHEHFDAITLDVFMPGMNGFDVLRAMRDDPRLRDIPVIFVSVASRAPELAGEWAVPKPIDRARLTEVIGAAIQARRSRVLVVAPEALRAAARAGARHAVRRVPLGSRRRRARCARATRSSSRSRSCTRAWARRPRSSTEPPYAGAATDVRSSCSRPKADGQAAAGGVGMPVFGLSQAVSALRLGARRARHGWGKMMAVNAEGQLQERVTGARGRAGRAQAGGGGERAPARALRRRPARDVQGGARPRPGAAPLLHAHRARAGERGRGARRLHRPPRRARRRVRAAARRGLRDGARRPSGDRVRLPAARRRQGRRARRDPLQARAR